MEKQVVEPKQPRFSKRPHNQFSRPDPRGSKPISINRLKAKIRDTTRLLARSEKLPADVRIEKERALAGYQYDLEQAIKEKRKKQMIKKYHMVRFFERKKASRMLKQAQKRLSTLSAGTAEYENVQSEVHNAEVDLNYTMYHPLDEKYHSLYPPNEGNTAKGEGKTRMGERKNERAARPSIWAVVEQCMDAGTLIALRDGKLWRKIPDPVVAPAAPTVGRCSHTVDKSALQEGRKSKAKTVLDDEGNESDGGFFEI